ncbi:thioredoxin family protein [Actinomadura soli]|uniref:thioredoxin family protein n=1 Tax=Actinomadura soli TaxID=2508997 RepID=UPI00197AAC00|nr:thioredoxin family protein [Actinomadura soli]
MELTVLTVLDCPHGPVLQQRLAEVLADHEQISVTWRVISVEGEAVRWGMRGSPTLLMDGIDPFADPSGPPSLSCRMFRESGGRLEGAPSVAALRRALRASVADRAGVEAWTTPGRLEAPIPGRVRGYGTPEEVLP